MLTLKLVAAFILFACVFMAAMNVYAVAGIAHAGTIAVMGTLAVVVMFIKD